MIVYAVPNDLTAGDTPWIPGSAPSNAATLLRWASILVAKATNRDLYNDQPTTQDAAILNDATCAQVAAWVALGVDPAKAGTDFPAPVKSSTILDGKIDRDTSRQNQAITEAANGLCDQATAILQSGGLLYIAGPLVGDAACVPTWGLDVAYDPQGAPAYSWGTQLADWPDIPAAVDAEIERLLG